ncbi:MAG: GspE/PulE family protein [Bacteroidota bacterium]
MSSLPFDDLAVGPAVQQVDRLITRAAALRASDIHIEPYESSVRIRYRLDGVLHLAGTLAPHQHAALVSRIKVLSGLDIAEKRRPQDGRLRVDRPHSQPPLDLRVSVLATHFGEKVVLRLLDRSALRLDLEALGFDPAPLALLRAAIHRPHGIVLVTGPTGSGKTTTLYAALSEIDTDRLNVSTVEDPIEYDLPGVNQTQARPDIGLGFAEALRAFLRQDPDVLMVGEIRDTETAEIAVRAALTGHLVLATLHTNDAAGAVMRLADMGVAPYLLASSLRLVAAQRLLRTLCSACKRPAQSTGATTAPFESVGCPECNGTGYRGRAAILEALPLVGHAAQEAVRAADSAALRALGQHEGWPSLAEAASRAVSTGTTSQAEALRVTEGLPDTARARSQHERG